MTTLPVPAIEAATAALAGMAWEEMDGTDAVAAAVALGRLKAVVDGALVGAAERLGATAVPEALGWASTKDFLTHVLGGRKGAGGSYVRLADRTKALPQVREALVAGEVSMAQAVAITTRAVTLPHVIELRERAADKLLQRVADHGYDATDLDHCFPEVVAELDPDGTLLGNDLDLDKQERGAHQARHLSLTPDTLGGAWIKGYGTLEEAELIKAVLMPLAAPVTSEPGACGGDPTRPARDQSTGRLTRHGCPTPACAHDGRDPRDAGVRMWDALVEACTRLQATDTLPHAHGTTARITVTTTIDDLHDRARTAGLLPSGARLSAAAVRRLACDAEIVPAVLGTQSQVLDVGRGQRLVTTAIWLALVLRDQHCAFPGCTRLPLACDAHHITHWADGGTTSLDNLVLLCRRHHTLTHHTPWHVELDPATRRPRWIPPPLIDDTDRFSYGPPRPRPLVA